MCQFPVDYMALHISWKTELFVAVFHFSVKGSCVLVDLYMHLTKKKMYFSIYLCLFPIQQNQEIVLERWTPVLVNGCDLKITGYVKRYGILYCFF
jgi:hypothetical protein